MPVRKNAYGIINFQIARVGTDGIATGNTDPNGTLTPDTVLNPIVEFGSPLDMTLPSTSRRKVNFVGLNYFGSAMFGVESIEDMTLTSTHHNAEVNDALMDAKVNSTKVTGAEIGSYNTNNPSPNDVMLMCSHYIQSRDDATEGSTYYRTWIFPKVQGAINDGGLNLSTGDNPQPMGYTFSPKMVSRYPNGAPFVTADEQFFGNREISFYMEGLYQYTIATYIADGTATTYQLPYLPASTTVTDFIQAINGTVTAPDSVSTGGLVTLASAGASGDKVSIIYPTAFQPSS